MMWPCGWTLRACPPSGSWACLGWSGWRGQTQASRRSSTSPRCTWRSGSRSGSASRPRCCSGRRPPCGAWRWGAGPAALGYCRARAAFGGAGEYAPPHNSAAAGLWPPTAAAQHLMPDLCSPLAPRMQCPSSATTGRPRAPRPALPRPRLPYQVADFEQESGDDEELAAALRHVTQLTRLECETTRIIPHLAPLTALGALTLHNASAADLSIQDLEQLRELPALRCLCFGRGLPEGAARHRRLEVRAGVVGSVAGWRQGLTEHAAQFASGLAGCVQRLSVQRQLHPSFSPRPPPPPPPFPGCSCCDAPCRRAALCTSPEATAPTATGVAACRMQP